MTLKRWYCAGLALMIWVSAAHGAVIELTGSYQALIRTRVDWRCSAPSGIYTQVRIPLPAVPIYNVGTNFAEPLGWTVEVLDNHGNNLPFFFHPYHMTPNNEGLNLDPHPDGINAGAWISVWNPSPGAPFTFTIRTRINGRHFSYAYGVSGSVPVWPPLTDYTLDSTGPPTYGRIDSDNPIIQNAVDAAMTDPRWQTNLLPGVRGQMEKIALKVASLNYRSGIANLGYRYASQVYTSGIGDCDDFTKLQVAMLRRIGVPARVVLVASIPSSLLFDPLLMGGPCLHAFGQYWAGSQWESFEPSRFENGAFGDCVVLGVDQDFAGILPVSAESASDGRVQAQVTVAVAGGFDYEWGGYSQGAYRHIGPARDVYYQAVTSGSPSPVPPFDDVLGPGSGGGEGGGGEGEIMPAALRVTAFEAGKGVGVRVISKVAGTARGEVYDLAGRRVGSMGPVTIHAGEQVLSIPLGLRQRGLVFVRMSMGGAAAAARAIIVGQ